jgi:hypothetical protein
VRAIVYVTQLNYLPAAERIPPDLPHEEWALRKGSF